jgi:phosphatidylinositol glycan class M
MSILKIFKNIFLHKRYKVSLFIRYIIIIITEYLYYNYGVLYTDIDYHVFSDGAKHAAKFESPYERETYRYTPLLAILMIPNIKIWYPIGKFLLSTIDVGVGYLIEKLLRAQEKQLKEDRTFNEILKAENDEAYYNYASLFYLYNPLTIVICTRGSADCIITFLVLLSLIYLEKKKYYLSALIYGFAVHFKIYPIIYAPSLFLYLLYKEFIQNKNGPKELEPIPFFQRIYHKIKSTIIMVFSNLFTKTALFFVIISSGVFFFFLALFYKLIGYKFLYEYLLYHLIRKDHRHNYSIFYYTIYLTYDNDFSKYLSLITFLPQMILILSVTIFLYKDINLCLIVLTMIFVHFNKVITAQYFIWYLSLIPLIIHRNLLFGVKKLKAILLLTIWMIFEIIWNRYSHLLEYEGQNYFMSMWIVNILFFLTSCWIVREIIVNTRKIEQ